MANEKRLIYAEDAKRRLIALAVGHHSETLHIDMILNAILHHTPTVDAVEVVHGYWQKSIDNECVMHRCSVCGARVVKNLYEYENPNRYCYHCGAKMDGVAARGDLEEK